MLLFKNEYFSEFNFLEISPCADLKINCNFGVCVDAGADYR